MAHGVRQSVMEPAVLDRRLEILDGQDPGPWTQPKYPQESGRNLFRGT
jgi:hypothetical protein